jgi:hypothetical protein
MIVTDSPRLLEIEQVPDPRSAEQWLSTSADQNASIA